MFEFMRGFSQSAKKNEFNKNVLEIVESRKDLNDAILDESGEMFTSLKSLFDSEFDSINTDFDKYKRGEITKEGFLGCLDTSGKRAQYGRYFGVAARQDLDISNLQFQHLIV